MTLLEEQVVDLQDDITVIVGDVVDLDEDVGNLDQNLDFLFDEQVIKDERLFSLEQANIAITSQLEGKDIGGTKSVFRPLKKWGGIILIFLCCHFRFAGHNSCSGFPCDDSGGEWRG